jgi:peptidyl-prolyl cis-trans isomerase B (cyclophilin B)
MPTLLKKTAQSNCPHPIATIHMASGEHIKIEIYPEVAPNTASSFIWLVQQKAFDNRFIKRIVPDFVIQPSYTSFDNDPLCDFVINGEFRANGFDNPLTISKYTVAMGGDGETLASGSCFFIAVGDCEDRLDGKYAAFGRVIEGFEVIDRLVNVETVEVPADIPGVVVNEPKFPEIMAQVTVDTCGMTFEEPVKTVGVWAYEKKQIQIGGTYKHYKGNLYKVICLAKNSETLEDMIVYQAQYDNQEIWVRPLKMFIEYITVGGKRMRRFENTSLVHHQ